VRGAEVEATERFLVFRWCVFLRVTVVWVTVEMIATGSEGCPANTGARIRKYGKFSVAGLREHTEQRPRCTIKRVAMRIT